MPYLLPLSHCSNEKAEHNPSKAKQPPGVTRNLCHICFWGRASGRSLRVSPSLGGRAAKGSRSGETALKRLTQPEAEPCCVQGKALMHTAEAWRQPRAGRAAEAASGRGLGAAGCVRLWATTGASFSSLPTASKTTEPAAERGGGVKIESRLHSTMCPVWM